MNIEESIKYGTLVVAAASALFSLLGLYRQRKTQIEIENLKDHLSRSAVVHQKQMEVREELLAILDTIHGAEALRESSIVREDHEFETEAEAVKIQRISYRINDWYRRNELFISSSSEVKSKLSELLILVEATSFEVQTSGPPMDRSKIKPLELALDGLVETALDKVNRPLRRFFAPIVEAST